MGAVVTFIAALMFYYFFYVFLYAIPFGAFFGGIWLIVSVLSDPVSNESVIDILPEPAKGFALLLAGVWLFLPGFHAKLAAQAYGDRDLKFWEAHQSATAILRAQASLLPIIGRFF